MSICSLLRLTGCNHVQTTPPQFDDETPRYPQESAEEISEPTVYTELPTNTNEEIITQEDSSL